MDWFENALDFLYPTKCGICGKIDKEGLCKCCEIMMKQLQKEEYIEKVEKSDAFDKRFSLFPYTGFIRELLLSYKFQDASYLATTFTKILLKNENCCRFINLYDIIIPVPIHQKRYRQRGYNQSELIARKLANATKLGLEVTTLQKKMDNEAQSRLDKKDRFNNVEGVYFLKNKEKIQEKHILLLDDIYTTGATVNACSSCLKQAKIKSIGVLTIAKD